jgi:hypothetical protein
MQTAGALSFLRQGQQLTQDMGAYWEVILSEDNYDRLSQLDVIYIPIGRVSSGISVDNRTTSTTGTTATANIYFGTAGGSVQSTIVQLAQQF